MVSMTTTAINSLFELRLKALAANNLVDGHGMFI